MRTMRYKMERPDLVKAGDRVNVTEHKTALNYTYIIEPAIAMSGCYHVNDRLKTREGVVKEVIENERGYYVFVDFNENTVEPADMM
ncbi:MAG: hypothetical protein VZR00_10320 [Lachnospiraceae bacterium]|jgi:hypothetical protein|nr:hypothetical protein [Lachnospiraceae bacterium]MEE3462257.1 hypothetical protein [Lachnospiraceae bacterium]